MLSSFKKILARDGEVYLRIKARPNASQTLVKQVMADETMKLEVAAPPVKGQANQEIIKFLAKEFVVSKDNIKIIAGAGEPLKLIKVKK